MVRAARISRARFRLELPELPLDNLPVTAM
jgi:hypothetical protein